MLYNKLPKLASLTTPPSIYPLQNCKPKSVAAGESSICGYHFMHFYLTFSFYSCIVPFRPVFDCQSGHYKLHTSVFQRVLCLIGVCVPALFYKLTQLRRTWQISTGVHSTIFYFRLANSLIFTCRSLMFWWTLFRKQKVFEDLLDKISHSMLLFPNESSKRAQKWAIIVGLHVFYAIYAVLAPILGIDSPPIIKLSDWSPSSLFRSYVSRANFTFFVQENATIINHSSVKLALSATDILLGCLEITIKFIQDFILSNMNILLFSVFPFSLWVAANNFEKLIDSLAPNFEERHQPMRHRSKLECQTLIWDKYHELKYLSAAFNSTLSPVFLLAILDIIPWLAVDLDYELRANDWCEKVLKLFIITNVAVALVLAAEIPRKMQNFKAHLMDWNNSVNLWEDRDKLNNLIRELQSAPIGIGLPGLCQIDYSLFGQLIVVVITFFIISLQYQSG